MKEKRLIYTRVIGVARGLVSAVAWLVIVYLLTLGAQYLFNMTTQSEFRDSLLGNLLATLIGVIAGIPVALYITRIQLKVQERGEKNRQEQEAKNRETKVLTLLKRELELNHALLVVNIVKQENNPRSYNALRHKHELWRALSDGGELQWISSLDLLNDISNAYYYIDMLINLEERYADPSFAMPITDGENTTFLGERIVDTIVRLRTLVKPQVETALDAIDTFLSCSEYTGVP